jgi:DNA mismatch endonuclease (patch repair protein)
MGSVRQKDNAAELVVQKAFKRLRRRFSTDRRDLPGSPDVVFQRQRVAVFVHGCFWHRHKSCKKTTTPRTRKAFWLKKFSANQKRDHRNEKLLAKLGWKVFVLWECELTQDWVIPTKLARSILKEKQRASSPD